MNHYDGNFPYKPFAALLTFRKQLADRECESQTLFMAVLAKLEIVFVVTSCIDNWISDLARGQSHYHQRYRHTIRRFQPDHLETNQELTQAIEKVASENSLLAGQVTLAWVLAQGENTVPLLCRKQRISLEENGAALIVKLTVNDRSSARKRGCAAWKHCAQYAKHKREYHSLAEAKRSKTEKSALAGPRSKRWRALP